MLRKVLHSKTANIGAKFGFQKVLGGYIVDFWCPQLRIAIEVDGPYHLQNQYYDRAREAELIAARIYVLRFTNEQIERELPQVVHTIRSVVAQRKKRDVW